MPIIRQAEQLDENRIVFYKKGKQLGQGYFIVEISSNNTHLFIAAYDVESPESLLIELPEKRATDILKEFSNDYEAMASSLQVMNKRLVLLNPVSDLNSTDDLCRNLPCKNDSTRHQEDQEALQLEPSLVKKECSKYKKEAQAQLSRRNKLIQKASRLLNKRDNSIMRLCKTKPEYEIC